MFRKSQPSGESPYHVYPFDLTRYERYNEHPAVKGEPSKQKKPGWNSGYPQRYVLGNAPLGVMLTHVIRCDKEGNPLYDHYLRLERGGGVFLPFDEKGRVGLLPVPRPTTRDQDAWAAAFDQGYFNYELLGRTSYEVPRGMGKKGEKGSQTAAREASEEMGGMVVKEYDAGWLVDNTTFCPHQTKLTLGMVDLSKAPLPKDKLEGDIGKAKFLTLEEIFEMEEAGDVYDCFTLAATHRFERMVQKGDIRL